MTYTDASILDSVKKQLGMGPEYTDFDVDIITHTNTVFALLQQLAVGPANGFIIEDNTTKWSDYLPTVVSSKINMVRTFVYLKVRLLFDPPTTSFAIDSFTKQAEELQWRLNVEFDPLTPPEEPEDD